MNEAQNYCSNKWDNSASARAGLVKSQKLHDIDIEYCNNVFEHWMIGSEDIQREIKSLERQLGI